MFTEWVEAAHHHLEGEGTDLGSGIVIEIVEEDGREKEDEGKYVHLQNNKICHKYTV